MNLDVSAGATCPLCGDVITRSHKVKTSALSNMTFRDDVGVCKFVNRGTGHTYVYVHVPVERQAGDPPL